MGRLSELDFTEKAGKSQSNSEKKFQKNSKMKKTLRCAQKKHPAFGKNDGAFFNAPSGLNLLQMLGLERGCDLLALSAAALEIAAAEFGKEHVDQKQLCDLRGH